MQTQLTFAQRMTSVMRRTQAAQSCLNAPARAAGWNVAFCDCEACRVAPEDEAVIRRAPLRGEEPNTCDLPVLNSPPVSSPEAVQI